MNDILKGVTSIWLRLFDHKSFLNGEIQLLHREFEVKRNDQEIVQLFDLVENITNIKDTNLSRLNQVFNNILPISTNLIEAIEICTKVNNLRNKSDTDALLEIVRKERKVKWIQFMDNITSTCTEIDKAFAEKELELIELYKNLETKLYKSK